MKKSYLKRLICLGVAGLVLCSALAVAAVTGSPYEVLKSAIFKGLQVDNGTIKTYANMSLEGYEELAGASVDNISYIGDKASLDVNNVTGRVSYNDEDFSLYTWSGYKDEETWYTASSNEGVYSSNSFSIDSPMDEMSSAEQRFIELLLDFFVGDLKNNITMYEKDGIRYISGTLTSMQIPEIVNAGLDVVTQELVSDYSDSYSDPDEPPLPKKLRVTYVHGDAQVDSEGNLLELSGDMTIEYTDINDVVRDITVSCGMEITDVGTTDPQCPVEGVKELLDEYREDGYNYSQIRFAVKEDGAIDMESVTDMMK